MWLYQINSKIPFSIYCYTRSEKVLKFGHLKGPQYEKADNICYEVGQLDTWLSALAK